MFSFLVEVKKCIIKSTPNGMLFSISVYCSISAINALNGKSLKCKRFPSPSSETDILEYAYNIVQTNEVGVEIIGTANVTDGKAYGYSPGLILHNYDTCAILLVNFTNGNIQTNICTRAGGWKGWKEFAGV